MKEQLKLVPLYPEEEAGYRTKEKLQRRAIGWFGLATGLALALRFARVYYEFVSARHLVPGVADSEYFDLEWTALLGIAVGILLAIIPGIITFIQSKRPPEAFAAKRFTGSSTGNKILGIITIIISIGIVLIGAFGFFGTKQFGAIIGFEGAEFIAMFGALLVAAPLFIEGLWVLYTSRRGIEKVLVLRKGKWSSE
ncbi:MAG TPA: hypothetical protein ENN75_00035 [candidate division Zixibacteria bacterium]|nr:hypothetical protein [candidate division Zixibacteria bacterium]